MFDWKIYGPNSMPKKAGRYLVAFPSSDGTHDYGVVSFYKKGDNIFLCTSYENMPEDIKKLSGEERLLWGIMKDVVQCPKDGFYCSEEGSYWELNTITYWCEIKEAPDMALGGVVS